MLSHVLTMVLLLVLVLALALGCGSADTADDTGSSSTLLTPTVIVSVATDATSSSVAVASPPISATAITSPVASPDALSAALPDAETVSAALGVELSEREIRRDLSQAFEGADFSVIDAGVVGMYRGVTQDHYVIIDIAQFRDVVAALAFIDSTRPGDSEPSSDRRELNLSGIGDETFGFVLPDTEDERLTIGITYLRVGAVVSAIVTRSNTTDIEMGMRELVRLVANIVE